MKALFVVVILIILVIPAFANELLVNGNFEQAGSQGSSNLGPGWNVSGGFEVTPETISLPGSGYDYYFKDFCPLSHTGQKSAAVIAWQGGDANGVYYSTGAASQTIPLSTGRYILNLSGYVWLHSRSGYGAAYNPPSWFNADLYVDGIRVGNIYESAEPDIDSGLQDTWIPVSCQWSGSISSSVSLVLTQYGDVSMNRGLGVVLSDDWSLQATAVPEPSSILALVSSIATLGFLKRRKRG